MQGDEEKATSATMPFHDIIKIPKPLENRLGKLSSCRANIFDELKNAMSLVNNFKQFSFLIIYVRRQNLSHVSV